ncbi:MAG: OmpA family protein [Verrucomicrobia bacterium]|nr:OmpA family protein [Verrucomicrobiota bacterium]
MKNLPLISRVAFCGVLLLSLNACALFKKKKQYAGMSDSDMVSGAPLPERQEGVSFTAGNVDKTRFAPVQFGYDSVAVAANEIGKLNEVAKFMESSDKMLIIAGFTDERGTAEYNRGLGERRAQAVRSYLLQKGADTERIQTTSFGSEMPADSGHNESAWAKNRRAEFGVTK